MGNLADKALKAAQALTDYEIENQEALSAFKGFIEILQASKVSLQQAHEALQNEITK